jgi:hypothetical protein
VNDHFNVRPDGTVNEFFHCHDQSGNDTSAPASL